MLCDLLSRVPQWFTELGRRPLIDQCKEKSTLFMGWAMPAGDDQSLKWL